MHVNTSWLYKNFSVLHNRFFLHVIRLILNLYIWSRCSIKVLLHILHKTVAALWTDRDNIICICSCHHLNVDQIKLTVFQPVYYLYVLYSIINIVRQQEHYNKTFFITSKPQRDIF